MRPFEANPPPTEAESYKNGFETGLAWDSPWIPGGPWVCRAEPSITRDVAWEAYCAQTVRNNAAWRKGWAAGKALGKEKHP